MPEGMFGSLRGERRGMLWKKEVIEKIGELWRVYKSP
jgi:hypothetical protein